MKHALWTLALTACAHAQPVGDGHVAPEIDKALARLAEVESDLRALSAADRAATGASFRALVVEDPFTRATVQLPLALSLAADQVDESVLSTKQRDDWRALTAGLHRHAAVYRELDADLRLPLPGDNLFDLQEALLVDETLLLAADDPLVPTWALVDSVPALIDPVHGLLNRPDTVDGTGSQPLDRVRFHTGRINRITGHPWTLRPQLAAWRAALHPLAIGIEDPSERHRVERMVALLDSFLGDGGC